MPPDLENLRVMVQRSTEPHGDDALEPTRDEVARSLEADEPRSGRRPR